VFLLQGVYIFLFISLVIRSSATGISSKAFFYLLRHSDLYLRKSTRCTFLSTPTWCWTSRRNIAFLFHAPLTPWRIRRARQPRIWLCGLLPITCCFYIPLALISSQKVSYLREMFCMLFVLSLWNRIFAVNIVTETVIVLRVCFYTSHVCGFCPDKHNHGTSVQWYRAWTFDR